MTFNKGDKLLDYMGDEWTVIKVKDKIVYLKCDEGRNRRQTSKELEYSLNMNYYQGYVKFKPVKI